MAIRKPGLWHGPRRVEVEDVTARHKKPCDTCGRKPRRRRLRVVDGVARAAKTTVLCSTCGSVWIDRVQAEASRAANYLVGNTDESIRR